MTADSVLCSRSEEAMVVDKDDSETAVSALRDDVTEVS